MTTDHPQPQPQRRESNGPPKPRVDHFSHHHTLTLTPKPQNPQLLCSCCNLSAATSPSGSPWIYSCSHCSFFLHVSCSRMPPSITHPSCPHSLLLLLLLLPSSFRCAACLKPDSCFSYHCKPCGISLHTYCAAAPLSLSHSLHRHPLSIRFRRHRSSFTCAACLHVSGHPGGWVYRCDGCDFDVHFGCARLPAQQHPQMAGMLMRPQSNGVGLTMMMSQQQQQQQAMQNFAAQMVMQGVQNGNMGFVLDPSGCASTVPVGVDPTGGGGFGGVDPTGGGVDPGAMGGGGGGFDFGAVGGGFDFGGLGNLG